MFKRSYRTPTVLPGLVNEIVVILVSVSTDCSVFFLLKHRLFNLVYFMKGPLYFQLENIDKHVAYRVQQK